MIIHLQSSGLGEEQEHFLELQQLSFFSREDDKGIMSILDYREILIMARDG